MPRLFELGLGIALVVGTTSGTAGQRLQFVEAAFDGLDGVDGLHYPYSVAMSPDGSNLYAAAYLGDSVAVFSRDGSSGALTFIEAHFDGSAGVDGLNGATSVTVSPDGRSVYVAGFSDNAVAVFWRNGSNGALTFLQAHFDGSAGVDGLNGATSVAVSPDGRNVYVTASWESAVAVFSRDGSTGALTFIAAHFDGVGGVDGLGGASSVALSPDGSSVYVAGWDDHAVAVFSRNQASGVLTFVEAKLNGVGGVSGLLGAKDLTVSPDGAHLYVVSFMDSSVTVFSRDQATGALDNAQVVATLTQGSSVVVSPDGKTLFATGIYWDQLKVFDRDAVTGAVTLAQEVRDGVAGVDGIDNPSSSVLSPDGRYLYVAGIVDSAVAVFRTLLFGNGFETGDTSQWSLAVGSL